MLGPQRQLLNRDKVFKKAKKKALSEIGVLKMKTTEKLRKVRVICNDPDATDSSSDEDERNEKNGRGRRLVREFHFPIVSAETELSYEDSNYGSKPVVRSRNTTTPNKTPRSSKYKGVRQRRWGKWAAEIRDPMKGVRVWLGTFETAEQASEAYQKAAKKLESEMERIGFTQRGNNKAKPALSATGSVSHSSICEDNESHFSHSSPSSVLDVSTSTSVLSGSNNSRTLEDIINSTKAFEPTQHQELLVTDLTDQIAMSTTEQDMDIGFELDSFLMNDFGQVFDGDFGGFDDIPSFDGLEKDCNIDDILNLDLTLGADELSWIDEHLNVACP